MEKLKRYIVPIELVVLGESPHDAASYVHDAMALSNILEQDGIIGVTDEVDVEDIVELSPHNTEE